MWCDLVSIVQNCKFARFLPESDTGGRGSCDRFHVRQPDGADEGDAERLRVHPGVLRRGREHDRVAHEPARVLASPATHAILAQLKAGETVYQTGELTKTLKLRAT